MKKVVLLGDSIRLWGYGTVIDKYLPDCEIYQPEENCMFAKYTLRLLFDLGDKIKGADVIHFNTGIWDTCTLYGDGIPFSSIPEYVSVVSRIADLLLTMGKKVIFSTTCPIRVGQPHNTNERIDEYNAAVVEMLKTKGVIINDLHGVIASDIEKYIRSDDCIHLTEEGIKVAAESVSSIIKKYL